MLGFHDRYRKEVVPALKTQLSFGNSYQVPRVLKATVNMGVGRIFRDESHLKEVQEVLRLVTGQEPAKRKARTAIATFKTRVGSPIGLSVTLRGKRLGDFLDRLVHVALARTRDFRGIPQESFDEQGNLTLGIREHIVFPETTELAVRQMYGFAVTVATNARNRGEGVALLKALGFPIQGDKSLVPNSNTKSQKFRD